MICHLQIVVLRHQSSVSPKGRLQADFPLFDKSMDPQSIGLKENFLLKTTFIGGCQLFSLPINLTKHRHLIYRPPVEKLLLVFM